MVNQMSYLISVLATKETFTNTVCVGRKSGKGIFLYEKGVKDRPLNPGAADILNRHKIEPKGPITDEDIQLRLVSRFVNEIGRAHV